MLAVGWGVKDGKSEAETCTSSCQAGVGGSGNGQMYNPTAITFSGGNMYVDDYSNSRVEEFSTAGAYISKFGSYGSGSGQFNGSDALATDPTTGDIYVADSGNNRIQKFTAAGTFLAALGSSEGSGNGQFNLPTGVVVNSSGDVYVADHRNYRVQELAPVEVPSNAAPAGISGEIIVGQTLTASTGTWAAVPSPTYTYRWQHCNSSGASCSNISGATNSHIRPWRWRCRIYNAGCGHRDQLRRRSRKHVCGERSPGRGSHHGIHL